MGGGRVSVVRVWGHGWGSGVCCEGVGWVGVMGGGGRVSVVRVWGHGWGRVSVVRVWGHGWGSGVCCEGVGSWVGVGWLCLLCLL